MLSLICRHNGLTLWSFGNYQYQLEWSTGRKLNFEVDLDTAVDRFMQSLDA